MKPFLAYIIIILFGSPTTAVCQDAAISFYDAQHSVNVDYYSFPGLLMLKHQIGEFRKLPKNPVLSPSSRGWDKKDVSNPYVLVTADTVFLFYDGSRSTRYKIGYAVRDSSGWFWQKRGMILSKPAGRWDSFHQIAPSVVRNQNEWRLYYSGNNSDSELGYQIGVALKDRSGAWQYPSTLPVLPLDSTRWASGGNIYADVHYFPKLKIFKMWYSGFSGPLSAIGLATSQDGYDWEPVGEEAVFGVLPGVIAPAVVFNGKKCTMYFARLTLDNGIRTIICRTTSADGVNWGKIEPLLYPQEKWEGNKLMSPNLSYFDGRVHLFYCAQRGSAWRIGEAVADANFVENGLWRSKIFMTSARRIEIKYEMPPETRLIVSINDLAGGKSIPLNVQTVLRDLRRGVFSAITPLPGVAGAIQIEIQMETEASTRSPVVYEIKLLPD